MGVVLVFSKSYLAWSEGLVESWSGFCASWEILYAIWHYYKKKERKKERKKEERETHMGFSCYDNYWVLVQKALDKLDCSTVWWILRSHEWLDFWMCFLYVGLIYWYKVP